MLLSSSHNTFMIGLHLSQSLTCAAAPGVECCSVGLILHTQEAKGYSGSLKGGIRLNKRPVVLFFVEAY